MGLAYAPAFSIWRKSFMGKSLIGNYEMFKEIVIETLKDYLPEAYQDMEMKLVPVKRVNKVKDGICFFGDGPISASPTIYIDDMYACYQETQSLDAALRSGAEFMAEAMERPDVRELPDLNLARAKDNIVFQLVNTMHNGEMLAEMPSRHFQDLSIIYKWIVEMDDNGVKSAPVTNTLAGKLGMDEGQLFQCAMENTRRLLPPVVRRLDEMMKEAFGEGLDPEMMELVLEDITPERALWVISNTRGINGAGSMLYEQELHKLAEDLGSDLYILPSSVHEVLAVSTDVGDPEELAGMVAQVNLAEVPMEDRLSNQVYHYDKDLRRLTLATDTPNKRLDGMVAETRAVYDTARQPR